MLQESSANSPPSDSKKWTRIAGILLAILVLAAIVFAIWYFAFNNNSNNNNSNNNNSNNVESLPSSFFDWSNIPSQDTPRLLQVGQRIALFHMRTGGYVRAEQSGLLSTAGRNPNDDPWSQFLVQQSDDNEFPGTIRLQNVAIAGKAAEEGFIAIRLYNESGWIEMDARGKAGQYTPLYIYPPDDSAATNAAQLAATESKTVIEPSRKHIPITLSNPRALLYGSNLYPYLAFNNKGTIVENFRQKATRQSPESQFLLIPF